MTNAPTAIQHIRTGAGINAVVIVFPAHEGVVSTAPVQCVGPAHHVNKVIARAAGYHILVTASSNRIVSGAQVDRTGNRDRRIHINKVIAIAGVDDETLDTGDRERLIARRKMCVQPRAVGREVQRHMRGLVLVTIDGEYPSLQCDAGQRSRAHHPAVFQGFQYSVIQDAPSVVSHTKRIGTKSNGLSRLNQLSVLISRFSSAHSRSTPQQQYSFTSENLLSVNIATGKAKSTNLAAATESKNNAFHVC